MSNALFIGVKIGTRENARVTGDGELEYDFSIEPPITVYDPDFINKKAESLSGRSNIGHGGNHPAATDFILTHSDAVATHGTFLSPESTDPDAFEDYLNTVFGQALNPLGNIAVSCIYYVEGKEH